MRIKIKLVERESEMQAAFALRIQVFVLEQSVPEDEELDEYDSTAIHAIAVVGEEVIGTARLLIHNSTCGQIGRMALGESWRRQGIGGQILLYLEKEASSRGITQIMLHAQEYIKTFYSGHGYIEHGDPFLEAGISHIEMLKDIK
ncbi:MAG: GNAT family N-acetyltransferase [Chloroflexota bacterium]|nr:GNAT family N-acetyltransferase [Chloroflexota bacterium]